MSKPRYYAIVADKPVNLPEPVAFDLEKARAYARKTYGVDDVQARKNKDESVDVVDLDRLNEALADLETALVGSIVMGLAHEGEAGRIREIASGEFAPAELVQFPA